MPQWRWPGGWFFFLHLSYPIYCMAYWMARITSPGGSFIFLLFFAPLLFALRISIGHISFCPADSDALFWKPVITWTVSLLFMLAALLLIWYFFTKEKPFYGTGKAGSLKPYLLMLLIMTPLIILAARQPDFAAQYPKWKIVAAASPEWWQKMLFELSYGSDFFTIELFFRGFLVLAFAKWAGKDAILPMACFYCAIHFAKPAGECISSYIGGLLLGIVVYHTRSIWGGLLVHLGIAWLMEVAGYLWR